MCCPSRCVALAGDNGFCAHPLYCYGLVRERGQGRLFSCTESSFLCWDLCVDAPRPLFPGEFNGPALNHHVIHLLFC